MLWTALTRRVDKLMGKLMSNKIAHNLPTNLPTLCPQRRAFTTIIFIKKFVKIGKIEVLFGYLNYESTIKAFGYLLL
jgi:hypothetical protein